MRKSYKSLDKKFMNCFGVLSIQIFEIYLRIIRNSPMIFFLPTILIVGFDNEVNADILSVEFNIVQIVTIITYVQN